MYLPLRSAAVAAALLLWLTPAAAQPDPAPLTLERALTLAESRHPVFDAQRALLQAADARIAQAGLRPAPEVGVMVENALGSGQMRGLSGAESTLSYSQLIERGGLRDARIAGGQAARELMSVDAQAARLDVRAEVARRFVHVLSDQAQLQITREATALVETTAAEVDRRVAAARSPLAERSRMQVTLERARLDEEHAEHELLSSRRQLAAATGAQAVDFGDATGDLLALPELADFDTLLARLQSTPDLLRFASRMRVAESEMRLAQARAASGVTLGTGLRRLEQTDDVGLVFSASMPLFGATRQRSHIAEAQAQRDQSQADRQVALLKAQAQLFQLFQELHHAGVEFTSLQARVLPAAQQALQQTRYAYERGRYSLLELRDAQNEWATQRKRMVEAAAAYHTHAIEIQRLTGQPASAEPATAQP